MPRPGMIQQEIPQFLGVNLREERMDLADEELAKCINADLHLSPGTIVLRLGRTAQNSSALSDLIIRRITKANSTNYRIAGAKIYRGDTLLVDPSGVDLSSNLITLVVVPTFYSLVERGKLKEEIAQPADKKEIRRPEDSLGEEPV